METTISRRSRATTSIPTPTSNVGPLIPITLAPECLDSAIIDISLDPFSTTCVVLEAGISPLDHSGHPCYPSAYTNGIRKKKNPIFSPGSGCPAGYEPICTLVAPGFTLAAATNVEVWGSLASGDMAIGCCPSGYSCEYGGYIYDCVSTFALGSTFTAVYARNLSQTREITVNSGTRASLVALKFLYVPEKKEASYSSQISATTETNKPSNNGITTTSNAITPSGNAISTSAEGYKFSRGSLVAVIVSSLVFLNLLLISGILLYRRRRRKTNQALDTNGDVPHTEDHGKPELDASTKIVGVNELDATPLSELPGDEKETETCTQKTVELEGDTEIQLVSPAGKPPALHGKPEAASPQASISTATISRKPVGDPTPTKAGDGSPLKEKD